MNEIKLNKSDYAFDLPQELIAQTPAIPRDTCRMLCVEKNNPFHYEDKTFKDIRHMLKKGDVLVLNNSKVLPARLYGAKTTGAACEFLMLRQKEQDIWECLARPGKRLQPGHIVVFGGGVLKGEVLQSLENGNKLVKFSYTTQTLFEALDIVGKLPLPHYITQELKDSSLYQTEYAKILGSAAAPTAGLHFTKELLAQLEQDGVIIKYITLHVGIGTFRPVKTENILEHEMHSEWFEIPQDTADAVTLAKKESRRVISVGTTSTRTLEACYKTFGDVRACHMDTSIFIYPGFEFRVIDGLITNFHLPESTLIMLVSALSGYDNCMAAYKHAVAERYRFYSFGDAMFIY
ncbi:MAG: tRNA preQ1(34) S-adenosylmethionine ribosyltransferase-isomerase QueA [Oscillospiraceae bacterium]